MLATIITLLFTLTGIAAVLAITDSVMKARHAYAQLIGEAALMHAGFAVQVEARELRVRRSAPGFMPARLMQARIAALPLPPVPAFAAA